MVGHAVTICSVRKPRTISSHRILSAALERRVFQATGASLATSYGVDGTPKDVAKEAPAGVEQAELGMLNNATQSIESQVNFSVEKTLFANVAPAILDALTAARSKLLCECKDFKKPTQNQWDVEKSFFQTDAYFQSASEYLSLVKGFTEQTQVMLRSRDFEFDEPKLKEAYNLLLRVAGVFDAVLSWLGTASTTSTELGEDSLAQWRAEQTRAGNSDIQSLQRVKDFESGVVSKALNVVALAQAQELVLLRGVTKDVVDWVLMGKLAMDISRRYAAVAQFKSAKEQLANLQNKEVERSKTIIDRDLEIATARNLAVYLEKVC
ncbi:hypothetical protein DYB28_004402 [Aphanomyces astaci]|uniref:BRO1 domain-containing protein n=2 Tax=Aphanomyces astaci TaxID=112090 RepID=A0A9X8DTI7_APHAT|nr:hypothetical protein DYB28_004402 [Aphanomyces astaci]